MFTQISGNKKYTLSKIEYRLVDEVESLYLEFDIIEDVEFDMKKYTYGMIFNQEEMVFFTSQIESMKDYVLTKLIELNA